MKNTSMLFMLLISIFILGIFSTVFAEEIVPPTQTASNVEIRKAFNPATGEPMEIRINKLTGEVTNLTNQVANHEKRLKDHERCLFDHKKHIDHLEKWVVEASPKIEKIDGIGAAEKADAVAIAAEKARNDGIEAKVVELKNKKDTDAEKTQQRLADLERYKTYFIWAIAGIVLVIAVFLVGKLICRKN